LSHRRGLPAATIEETDRVDRRSHRDRRHCWSRL